MIKKSISGERSWFKKEICYYKQCEYEVVNILAKTYPVSVLCEIINVNWSGYYKWKSRKRKNNRYETDRVVLKELVEEEHKEFPNVVRGKCREWTYVLDIFNNEIISHHVIESIKGKTEPIIFHSDQGSVCSSRAFFQKLIRILT